MAITNHERVGKAMEALAAGLKPFVERELESVHGKYWVTAATESWKNDLEWVDSNTPHFDAAALLRLMFTNWDSAFRNILGKSDRSYVVELQGFRNEWAHQKAFSSDDAFRAIDTAQRLLTAVVEEADDLDRLKADLMRVRFDDQRRNEEKKQSRAVESVVTGKLTPWRDVVTPHSDVMSGSYQNAEFAADLHQVYRGEAGGEYGDPVEFFRRTFMTGSLKKLLSGAIRRLTRNDGDPVIQLQTNFGGGKTHSMLALYHLFSGVDLASLAGTDEVLSEAKADRLPTDVKRVVIAAHKFSPATPEVKADGTKVHTLWGELAYQLGGAEAYEKIRQDDEKATSPGDRLRDLLNEYGPAVILIDEWVAYARQLHSEIVLPGGTFETQFTFAQALSEAVTAARNCVLVVSLPGSDDSEEVGGARGVSALRSLQRVIGRQEAGWTPATPEEGFEIVRRRLFQPIDADHYKKRDHVCRAFAEMYRSQSQDFPEDVNDGDYEKRMLSAYPFHPELFDRLYEDWSSLPTFQRTRGVLRLMAAVVHRLWQNGDSNPVIMPGNVPIDDPAVNFELTRFLGGHWQPMISTDVDGESSLPVRLDSENSNLGRLHASRRVTRTVFLGSAPLADANGAGGHHTKGIEDRSIKLGCAMPGESTALFGDALRKLTHSATHLYQDGVRYWFSTKPTVAKKARDLAEVYRRQPDVVGAEIERRARTSLASPGDFGGVHVFPSGPGEVPDDYAARLVALGVDTPYDREANGQPALASAEEYLKSRGSGPRLYQNALVFLAIDKGKYADLADAVCNFLAWREITEDNELMQGLSGHEQANARRQHQSLSSIVDSRVPEAFNCLLCPVQTEPQQAVEWKVIRLSGSEALAARASKKLKNDDLLTTRLAGTVLRLHMDKVPLWHDAAWVSVRDLQNYFASYVYLPRLQDSHVLFEAIAEGTAAVIESEGFGFADSYDEKARRFVGLRLGEVKSASSVEAGILVNPEVARAQIDADSPQPAINNPGKDVPLPTSTDPAQPGGEHRPKALPVATRFHGSVTLDRDRIGPSAAKIAEEVISHLSCLVGSRVTVRLEIEADVPTGVSHDVQRIVSENSRTLGFSAQGFESEDE